MDGLSSFPRVSQLLVGTRADIARDETVHSFSSDLSGSLARVCDLGDLRIEDSLLVRVDFESGENVDLLDEKRRSILLSQLLSDRREDASRVGVLVCLAVELDCLHLLVLFDEVVGIALEELLNLNEVMLLSQLNGLVPLVEQDATVDGLLDIACLYVALDSQLHNTERDKLVGKSFQDGGVLWEDLNQLLQVGDVLHLVVALNQVLVVLGKSIVLGSLWPFLSL